MVDTTCFIIGPMGDANLGRDARLKRLARDIIKPLLEEEDWHLKVKTPFDIDGAGLIMDNVIAAIDHADLIIADLTGNNPNVFYELALCHALGLPTIVVYEEIDRKPIAFDVRAFSYNPIEIDDPDKSIATLRRAVKQVKRDIDEWRTPSNPVTVFYRTPITNISPAAGVAQGMFQNFVEPTGTMLSDLHPSTNEHLYELIIDGQPIAPTIEARRSIQIHVVIPSELRFVLQAQVDTVGRELSTAEIPRPRRPLTMKARMDEQGIWQLYDIPTAMNVLEKSIDRRANQINVQKNSTEWKQLEDQEIIRFHIALKQWIDEHPSDKFRERVNIIEFDVKGRDPKMQWLYEIWGL